MTLVLWWETTARPVVDLVYGPLVIWLGDLIGLKIEIPNIIKDYLAVGLVFILSRWRGITGGWSGGSRKALASIRRKPLTYFSLLFRTLFVWPLEILLLSRTMLFARNLFPERSSEEIYQIRLAHFISLLPVVYAFILVIANWLLILLPDNKYFRDIRR